MKLKDQRDLLARGIAAMITARDAKLDTAHLINMAGWYLMYSTGRDADWQVMLTNLIDEVTLKARAIERKD